MKFCTYLTIYDGCLLPPFYIGSTSLCKVNAGYRGSVGSNRYGKIWKSELAAHPERFTVEVLSTHHTRIEALQEELRLQIINNVVKSPLFTNQSLASVNGFFGRDTSGANHPRFGDSHSAVSRLKIKENHADVSGAKNGRAIRMRLTSPSGQVFDIIGCLKKFCEDQKLPYCTMNWILKGRVFTRGPCVGWIAKRL